MTFRACACWCGGNPDMPRSGCGPGPDIKPKKLVQFSYLRVPMLRSVQECIDRSSQECLGREWEDDPKPGCHCNIEAPSSSYFEESSTDIRSY